MQTALMLGSEDSAVSALIRVCDCVFWGYTLVAGWSCLLWLSVALSHSPPRGGSWSLGVLASAIA